MSQRYLTLQINKHKSKGYGHKSQDPKLHNFERDKLKPLSIELITVEICIFRQIK